MQLKTSTILLGVMLAAGMAFVPAAAADHDPEDEEIEVDVSGPIDETEEACFPLFPGAHIQEKEEVQHDQRVFVEGFEMTVGGQEVFVPGFSVLIGGEEKEVGGFWAQIPERAVTVDDVDETIGVDETVEVDEELPGAAACIEYAAP